MRVRIKMCGLRFPADALAAAQAGADSIGLVFYPPSKRAVSVKQAADIVAVLPAYISVVGLFVDPSAEQVEEVLAQVPLDELQFHGQETPVFCRQFMRRYNKAIPMNTLKHKDAIVDYMNDYPEASGFLLDAFGGAQSGGSGRRFDWSLIPEDRQKIIIAGGLNAENVEALITQYRPYAVDVSSGIESAPGVKSPEKMQAFAAVVYSASH
ncbi:phosphoribosylanthranilate isomerase [Suttonella sp. R2A3]|uniref:phosphoribosylanthranilate isomerase n=1 Tax=Suttonella sp. R2A3 TaxID=2908648 RepID=UPI001F178271|nr:phosphoribosylanthranilate isomerase [Suttonella sp. R2A3]UJF24536.1 phosphoribosylanthranilate isomerase [Suttonella sp. R2A3]